MKLRPCLPQAHLRAGMARQRSRLHALRQAVEAALACRAGGRRAARVSTSTRRLSQPKQPHMPDCLRPLAATPCQTQATTSTLATRPPEKLFMHVLHCPQRCFKLMAPAAAEARVRRMRSDSRQLRLCFTYRLARAS